LSSPRQKQLSFLQKHSFSERAALSLFGFFKIKNYHDTFDLIFFQDSPVIGGIYIFESDPVAREASQFAHFLFQENTLAVNRDCHITSEESREAFKKFPLAASRIFASLDVITSLMFYKVDIEVKANEVKRVFAPVVNSP
jgi:hypothetical protein